MLYRTTVRPERRAELIMQSSERAPCEEARIVRCRMKDEVDRLRQQAFED